MGKGRDKRKRHLKKQKNSESTRAVFEVRENPPPFEDPDALVFAKLKPKPRLGAGAVALPQPED